MLRRISGNRIKRTIKEINPEDVFLDSHNSPTFNMNQMEGSIERPLSPVVGYLIFIILLVVFGGFAGKLFSMQIVHIDTYKEQSDKNHLRSTPIFAHRGTISDRNGNLLAWNDSTDTANEVPQRKYTDSLGFAHILGYVSYPKKDSSGVFWQETYIGKDGVEKIYNDILSGVAGEKIIAINAHHDIESENVIVEPIHGENIKLTVDKNVQNKMYEAMKSLAAKAHFTGGAGVIMDIHTGEILSLTSYPEYDNNLLTNASSSEENKRVSDSFQDTRNIFLNRAVSGLFTPGSTVKPFIALAALMEGVITPEKEIFSAGQLVIKNKYGGPDTVFKDWKAHGYVDMKQAITESSDEYFYQIGGGYQTQKGLGILRIDDYAKRFGFSTTTGIDLPAEKFGLIPSPEWKLKTFKEDWLLGDTYHTSIGQYGFQITPLELVRGVAAIANGGYLVTPHVMSNMVYAKTDLQLPRNNLQVIQDAMLHTVTDQVEGTAKILYVDGVQVAAKSGTAELGVSKQLVNSWISGYFPYNNPKYAFVVIMEKGDRHNPYGAVYVMRETLEYIRDYTDYAKSGSVPSF
jgi:penicillin-binding protein 2